MLARSSLQAAPSTPACASPRTAPAAAGTARGGEVVGLEHPHRRRDRPARRRRARRARRAARRGRSPAAAACADSSPKPKSMTTGCRSCHEDVRRRAAPGGRAALRCSVSTCRHVASSSVVVDRLGVELVEQPVRRRARARAPSSRRAVPSATSSAGHRTPARRATRSTAPRARRRARATATASASFGPRSSSGAVAAVEQVGVAAVAGVDLDEELAAARRRRRRRAARGRLRRARA